MTSINRSKTSRELDLKLIAELCAQGLSSRKIAEEVSNQRSYTVSHVTVANDIKRLKKQWQHTQHESIQEYFAEAIAKLDNLECTYWDAWERSKQDLEKEIKRFHTNSNDEIYCMETVEIQESRTGNPRYLEGVSRCVELRCKLLGLFDQVRRPINGGQASTANRKHYPTHYMDGNPYSEEQLVILEQMKQAFNNVR